MNRIRSCASAETNPDPVSAGIMAKIKRKFSHTLFVVYVDEYLAPKLQRICDRMIPSLGVVITPGEWVFHSVGEGCRPERLADFLSDHVLVHDIDITGYLDMGYYEAVLHLAGNFGKEYASSQYLAEAFEDEGDGSIGDRIRDGLENAGEKLYCSEFSTMGTTCVTVIPLSAFTRRPTADFVRPDHHVDGLLAYVAANPVEVA